jgi:hypothetical protein
MRYETIVNFIRISLPHFDLKLACSKELGDIVRLHATLEHMSQTRLLLALPRLVRQRRSFSTWKRLATPQTMLACCNTSWGGTRRKGLNLLLSSLTMSPGCWAGRRYFHVAEHDSTCYFVLIRCSEGEKAGRMEQWSFAMFSLMIIYNAVLSRTH